MTENKRFKTKEELINHLKSIGNDRYIITIACEYLDTKTDEWLSIEQVFERLNSLNDENEQLKKELKVYRKIATCGNCNYHNYDWFDDGDEFEVCDKGNDTSNGICEDWEELD